jgi:transmembrane sensor
VKVGSMRVDVLGTHFNIMAYGDEQNPTTTLLTGKVKVAAGRVSSLLRPGQSAALDRANETIQLGDADVDAVTAWKDGLFQFNNADLPTVMRQLSRWYGVDVSYEGKQRSYEFVGRIRRSSNLSSVLKVLQVNGVKFNMEGKRLIVLQ